MKVSATPVSAGILTMPCHRDCRRRASHPWSPSSSPGKRASPGKSTSSRALVMGGASAPAWAVSALGTVGPGRTRGTCRSSFADRSLWTIGPGIPSAPDTVLAGASGPQQEREQSTATEFDTDHVDSFGFYRNVKADARASRAPGLLQAAEPRTPVRGERPLALPAPQELGPRLADGASVVCVSSLAARRVAAISRCTRQAKEQSTRSCVMRPSALGLRAFV